MDWIVLAKVIKETGIPIAAFILCAWMIVYIVKRMGVNLEKLEKVIDKQIAKTDLFMAQVKKEHEAQVDDHKEFSKQNKEITTVLCRINGYKDN